MATREEIAERINLIRKAREKEVDLETRLNIPAQGLARFQMMEIAELEAYMAKTDAELVAESKPRAEKVFQPTRKPVMVGDGNGMAEMMAQMLQPYMGVDEERVREIAAEVSMQVASGMITTTLDINITTPAGTVTIKGAHKQTDEILFWIGRGRHVYLWGAPGSGKTTVARHVATGLGRKFGYMMTNAMTSPANILGFVGADAKTYRPSAFREMYDQSAIMCIDEWDNCNPNTMTTINGPIENGECQFPDGLIAMHPEFKIIATGNTAGRGGNIMHAGRQSMDAASLARFIAIEFEYDLALEERMVKAAAPKNAQHVIRWMRDVRAYVKKNDVKLVVSPREAVNIGIGADYAPFSNETLVHHALFKGFNPDSITTILKNVPIPAWTRATIPAKAGKEPAPIEEEKPNATD